MTETVLDTRDLSMRFGGVQAVNHVNFSLRERELRCLIGPNGAGKSTLFKCLTGQIRLGHDNGRVFIRGQDVSGWRAYQIVRLGVGIKTQVPSVMNGLTVEENLWLSARRVNGREATREIPKLDMTILLTREVDLSRGLSGWTRSKAGSPSWRRPADYGRGHTQAADQSRSAYFSGPAQTCRQQLDMHCGPHP